MAMKRVAATLLATMVLGGLLAAMAPIASAAPKLIVYEVQVSAEPAIQGPDLPIVIKANVGSGGACCYVVYGMELRAEILLMGNLSLTDGERSQYLTSPGFEKGTVAAQPGGGLTWIMARWEISAPSLGRYEVAVRVTGTNDAGDKLNETSSTNITIASGAAISAPMLPHRPVVGKPTPILANVSSRKGVSSVQLFLSRGGSSWTSVPMSPVGGDLYSATIPAVSSEGTYLYYMESVDTSNESFRTGNYTLDFKDPVRISGISEGASVLLTAGSLVGMVLVIYFGTRKASVFRSKGIFVVGDARMEAAMRERETMREAQKRNVATRWKVLAALAILTVVLFIISILIGQLQSVVRHTTNPSEALIWLGR
jgi:hypothetical protein